MSKYFYFIVIYNYCIFIFNSFHVVLDSTLLR